MFRFTTSGHMILQTPVHFISNIVTFLSLWENTLERATYEWKGLFWITVPEGHSTWWGVGLTRTGNWLITFTVRKHGSTITPQSLPPVTPILQCGAPFFKDPHTSRTVLPAGDQVCKYMSLGWRVTTPHWNLHNPLSVWRSYDLPYPCQTLNTSWLFKMRIGWGLGNTI